MRNVIIEIELCFLFTPFLIPIDYYLSSIEFIVANGYFQKSCDEWINIHTETTEIWALLYSTKDLLSSLTRKKNLNHKIREQKQKVLGYRHRYAGFYSSCWAKDQTFLWKFKCFVIFWTFFVLKKFRKFQT